MCISQPPWSGARGLERLVRSKYDNVQKWKNRLTLRLNTAKNTDYMEKNVQIEVVEISISYKKCLKLFFIYFRQR